MYTTPRRPSYRAPQKPQKQTPLLYRLMTRKEFLFTISALITGALAFAFFGIDHGAKTPASGTTPANKQAAGIAGENTSTAAFNMKKYSLSDPKSLWLIVNKQRPLNPKTYKPAHLVVPNIALRSNITSTEKYVRADMATALEAMVKDAAAQGVHFNLQSGYRSYDFQVALYNGYVQSQGKAVADRQSARPGYSEHQTGLAADLGGTSQPSCNVEACYADTIEGKWLAANGYKYGFIIRYASDKESVTGYLYEPWHIRYIGTELSNQMHSQGVETLEQFFDVAGGTTYN